MKNLITVILVFTITACGFSTKKVNIENRNDTTIHTAYGYILQNGTMVDEDFSGNFNSKGRFVSKRVVFYRVGQSTFKVTMDGWDTPMAIETVK